MAQRQLHEDSYQIDCWLTKENFKRRRRTETKEEDEVEESITKNSSLNLKGL